MGSAGGGSVFVSYRRGDSGDAAGRLADRLADRFGDERVFMDVDAIEPGMDYVEAITQAVGACDVLVAVIGPGGLAATDSRGRRLDDPDDWVRVEVGTALARGIRVIPVLVGNASMPARWDLPEDLAGLARRNALRVRHESFRTDAALLVAAVERALALTARANDGSAPSPKHADAGSAKEGSAAGQRKQPSAVRVLPPDHPDTPTSRSNLGVAYGDAGRTAEAIQLREQTVADCERVLGVDHPDTLGTRSNLGLAYRDAGWTAEAVQLHEQALADAVRVWGVNHPATKVIRAHLTSLTDASVRRKNILGRRRGGTYRPAPRLP